MKKNILLHSILCALFLGASACAQERYVENSYCSAMTPFYAKIFAGGNFLQNTYIKGNNATYEPGYIYTGSLGYCWSDCGLRAEAEFAYRRNAISQIQFITQGSSTDGYFQTSSFMANLLWDWSLCSWGRPFWGIRPFVGGGIGYDHGHMHAENSRIIFSQEWDLFAWQVMTGLTYPIFSHAKLALEYKFHQYSHFYNHSVGIGLRYKLGSIR